MNNFSWKVFTYIQCFLTPVSTEMARTLTLRRVSADIFYRFSSATGYVQRVRKQLAFDHDY